MANRIKGITIEIDGSVQGLDKSLKEVNSSLSTTQRNLKDVDRLLKLDPKNTELLQQKQKLLADAVDGTRDKLDKLKDAEKQAKAQMESGDLGKDKYDALQREIIETEEKLKSLEKAQKSFGDGSGEALKAVGGKVQAVGDKMKAVGQGMTTHVTAPIVAAGAGAVAAWKEVDEAMDTVTKKTGASGEALEDMQQRAKNLAQSIPTDFQTAADAVGEVNTRFGLTGDALEDLSGKFVKFAELNDTDVSSSIDSVQSTMAAWGIEAEDAGKVLDLLNKAGQDTGVSVDKLSELLKTNKVALDEAGMSLSDSAMFLANLDKNGIDASTAITGLRKAFQEATKDGKTSKEALDELQAVIGNGADKASAYQAAIELFGKKAGPAIADACMEGRLSFEELGTTLSDFSGNIESTFNETLDPLDQMQMSMNTMKDLGAEIVESAAPMITEAMAAIRDVVTSLKEAWDGLSPAQQEFIIKAALVVAAIGPVLMIVGSVITTIGSLMTVLGGLGIGLAPFLAGGAIIIGIIAAAALIITHWDQIKEAAGKLKETVSEKFTQLKTNASNAWSELQTSASEKWNSIKDKVSTLSESIRSTVANNATSMKDSATSAWNTMKDNASNIFSSMQTTASNSFESIRNSITGKIDSAKNTISDTIDKIKSLFSFDWDLPDLELPHINVGSYITVPVLGTIPDPTTLSVDWYAKAMDTAMILRNPTIFGYQNGSLLGGGEAGEEVVAGKQTLLGMVKDAVRSVIGTARSAAGDMSALASQNLNIKYGDVHMTVYGAPGQDVRQLADIVERRLKGGHDREEAVWA